MNNITEPLQLAVSSHQPDSGKGCAMRPPPGSRGSCSRSTLLTARLPLR